MASSRVGRDLLVNKVQKAFNFPTKKEGETLVNKVIACIESVLVENIDIDNFSIKLNSLGKFTIRHSPSIIRKIPFTKELKRMPERRRVKFVSLGDLRKLSRKPE